MWSIQTIVKRRVDGRSQMTSIKKKEHSKTIRGTMEGRIHTKEHKNVVYNEDITVSPSRGTTREKDKVQLIPLS